MTAPGTASASVPELPAAGQDAAQVHLQADADRAAGLLSGPQLRELVAGMTVVIGRALARHCALQHARNQARPRCAECGFPVPCPTVQILTTGHAERRTDL